MLPVLAAPRYHEPAAALVCILIETVPGLETFPPGSLCATPPAPPISTHSLKSPQPWGMELGDGEASAWEAQGFFTLLYAMWTAHKHQHTHAPQSANTPPHQTLCHSSMGPWHFQRRLGNSHVLNCPWGTAFSVLHFCASNFLFFFSRCQYMALDATCFMRCPTSLHENPPTPIHLLDRTVSKAPVMHTVKTHGEQCNLPLPALPSGSSRASKCRNRLNPCDLTLLGSIFEFRRLQACLTLLSCVLPTTGQKLVHPGVSQ